MVTLPPHYQITEEPCTRAFELCILAGVAFTEMKAGCDLHASLKTLPPPQRPKEPAHALMRPKAEYQLQQSCLHNRSCYANEATYHDTRRDLTPFYGKGKMESLPLQHFRRTIAQFATTREAHDMLFAGTAVSRDEFWQPTLF